MALLIAFQGISPDSFVSLLREYKPDIDVRVWPDTGDVEDIKYLLAWKPPQEAMTACPNLEAIFSIGAGVDHILGLKDIPDVPLVRFVDPNLTMRMSEYVCLNVLMHHRRILDYRQHQARKEWQNWSQQPGANEVRVGVMGLGVLGQDAAKKLVMLGYQVAGWSRSRKLVEGIECFSGEEGMDAFLARTDILVSLLPFTPDTKAMLDAALFARLAKDGQLPGPVLINAGRGGSQVEADILAALESGDLWAASLDVFEEEPLPSSSALWTHPRVIVTPHNASISDNRAVCRYVLAQLERQKNGQPLENIVDAKRGY